MLNPLALPLHPAFVHFPMAMLTAAWVCIIARYATGNLRWDEASRPFELVGVIALPFTIVSALIDTRGIGFLVDPRVDAPLIWHMTAGLVAAAAFGAHHLWRRRLSPTDLVGRLATRDVLFSTFGMLALVAAGLLSAEMVYGT